jgi:dienelactone hydrolase
MIFRSTRQPGWTRASGGCAALLVCGFAVAWPARPVEPAVLDSLLARPVIGTNVALSEVQAFTENRVPLMPAVKTRAEWEALARQMRRETLDRVVFRGEAARWRKARPQVVWLETIPGGPGYHIRKLRYEAVPGLWIPALLYEPDQLKGKVPVVLNVNGHESVGKSVAYKQVRCINQVRRGMIALNPEWLGMGQLRGPGYDHAKMNQLDLCGTSGLAPFYLAMQRALDLLLDHPHADPRRVAVAGLSGGGWQTIFISSLDPRVRLSNPVAGYSSFRTRARFLEDLGDSEQTPCDLATVVDYTHLTAMRAPRPTLLTFNARDNCCFAAGHALQPLVEAAAPIFKLYGQEHCLRRHVNHEPGDHNFGQENREALYRMLGGHFYADQPFSADEIRCDDEVKSNDVCQVALPTNNASFNSLALALARRLPRQPQLPVKPAPARKWQEVHRPKLRQLVRASHSQVVAERAGSEVVGELTATFWRLRVDDCWTVPAVELAPPKSKATALVVADAGRRGAAGPVRELVEAGCTVLAVDPFYFGESRIRSHAYLFALLVAAVGERPLGIQAGQVAAIARWCQARGGEPVTVVAVGPRASAFALVAAGLEERAIGALHLHQSPGSLKEVIEQNWGVNEKPELFCFGLLETFDLQHLAALLAPRPLVLRDITPRLAKDWAELPAFYTALGGTFELPQPPSAPSTKAR